MSLLILLFIPLCVCLVMYLFAPPRIDSKKNFSRCLYQITFPEFLCQVAVVVALMIAGYYIALNQATTDTEIWNAQVTSKTSEKVSCEHSYSCNCRPVSCGKDCTTIHCDTCYEHSYDVSWYLHTSADEHIKIDRVNRQGTTMPPRWNQAHVGDPTALQHTFTNYIKANPWSLLNRTDEETQFPIPAYPIGVYDYHYVDRFIAPPLPDTPAWNRSLQTLNAELGVRKRVNIIVVVTKESEAFSHALENVWLGGKKNDVIVVIGSKDLKAIEWVRVISWSHSEVMKVELRDALLKIGTLDNREPIMVVLKDHVTRGYALMQMEDYKYLMAGVEPTAGAMWLLIILGLVVSGGLSIYFYQNETF